MVILVDDEDRKTTMAVKKLHGSHQFMGTGEVYLPLFDT